jgi:hypothetical protein
LAVLAAGLPNITGSVSVSNQFGVIRENAVLTGAFYRASTSYSARILGEGGGSNVLNFDASRSNGLYGAANTVQPPALCLIPQIKY